MCDNTHYAYFVLIVSCCHSNGWIASNFIPWVLRPTSLDYKVVLEFKIKYVLFENRHILFEHFTVLIACTRKL